MTSATLQTALLRPAVLQILRATGFNYTRPAVLDTLTDLAVRYLLLLASSAAQNSFNTHNSYVPTVQDVRLALLDAGALRPQMSVLEEQARGMEEVNEGMVPFEDLRGVEGFVEWAQGDANKEIRRVAGMGADEIVAELAAELGEAEDDYVTALKKKHTKSDTESRYQGTALGKDSDAAPVTIVGGPASNISDWAFQVMRSRTVSPEGDRLRVRSRRRLEEGATPATATSGISSAPMTPAEVNTTDDEGME